MIISKTIPAKAPISWPRMKCEVVVLTVVTQLHSAPGSAGVSYQTSIAGATIIAAMSPINAPESTYSNSFLDLPIASPLAKIC